MKVYIDADACPVVDIAVTLCNQYSVPCILVCDTAHMMQRKAAEVLIMDKGSDSVDFAIANRIECADIVVTQDYGLASMCLAKGASVIHQDGWEYTQWNIDALLLQRHEFRKYRESGGHTKGPKKRTPQQNQAFSKAFENLLQG